MRRQDGLTLLEMLIVVGVTALLVTAGMQAHLGIRRAQARAAQGLQRERAASVFLDRFEHELVGTILFGKPKDTSRLAHPYLFYGVHGAESGRLLDGLRFVTRSPARAYPGSESPGLRLVTYAASPLDEEELVLLRQEEPIPSGLRKELNVQDGQIALDDISSFRLRYLHVDNWRSSWDSTDVALLDEIPTEIEVAIQLFENDELGEWVAGPEYVRVIPLPVRPVTASYKTALSAPAAADPNQIDEEAGKCLTVEQCAHRFASGVIATENLWSWVGLHGGECYSEVSPNLLRSLTVNYEVDCR